MIALKSKEMLTDPNILYLECNCGCSLAIFEYEPEDQTLQIQGHQYANDWDERSSYLSLPTTVTKDFLQGLVSMEKEQTPLLKKFVYDELRGEIPTQSEQVTLEISNFDICDAGTDKERTELSHDISILFISQNMDHQENKVTEIGPKWQQSLIMVPEQLEIVYKWAKDILAQMEGNDETNN